VETHGQHDPSAAELHGPIVVQHVVAHLILDAHARRRPRLALVRRESQYRPAIIGRLFAEIEQCDAAVSQPQERYRHHVPLPFVRYDQHVVARPGLAVIGGEPRRQMGCRMIAASPGEMRVDEHHAAIGQRQQAAFAVPRITGPGRQQRDAIHAVAPVADQVCRADRRFRRCRFLDRLDLLGSRSRCHEQETRRQNRGQ
jgi:hypothetical protein